MKIELTIKTTYLPEWGTWEGIRELIQNGRDAEFEHSAKLTVRHRREAETLVIENEGTTLPYEALLLGHTTKAERSDMIGKFGEGLKLGVLALVRAGASVKIRSGSEVWTPSIQRSEKFNADVLVFDIQKGRKPESRVSIEIGGVTQETWQDLQQRFLFLKDTIDTSEKVQTYSGSLLLGDKFKGRIFVKGIFVSNDPRLSYGYDFVDAALDRDRKMLSKYDLNYRTQSVWRAAMSTRPDLVADFGRLLENEAADIEGVDEFSAGYMPEAAKKELARIFLDRHGPNALPVGSLAESAEIEHLGKIGVVVPKGLRLVLEKELGSVQTNKEKLREEVTKAYGWHELAIIEKAHLSRAIKLVNDVEPVTLESVDVTDFRDENLRGMFKDGRILLAKKILSDRALTLRVLVHEVAHRAGGDGEKAHVSNIERIWSAIVAGMSA